MNQAVLTAHVAIGEKDCNIFPCEAMSCLRDLTIFWLFKLKLHIMKDSPHDQGGASTGYLGSSHCILDDSNHCSDDLQPNLSENKRLWTWVGLGSKSDLTRLETKVVGLSVHPFTPFFWMRFLRREFFRCVSTRTQGWRVSDVGGQRSRSLWLHVDNELDLTFLEDVACEHLKQDQLIKHLELWLHVCPWYLRNVLRDFLQIWHKRPRGSAL